MVIGSGPRGGTTGFKFPLRAHLGGREEPPMPGGGVGEGRGGCLGAGLVRIGQDEGRKGERFVGAGSPS